MPTHFMKVRLASSATHDESLADSGVLAITRVKLFVLGDDTVRTLPQSRRDLSRLSHAERQNQKKTIRFFTVWHPRHHPHFLLFCIRGTFNTDLDKKKNLLKTPCLPSVFFFDVFHALFIWGGFWSSADPIRKWSRANPAFVFGCICSARRDSSGKGVLSTGNSCSQHFCFGS